MSCIPVLYRRGLVVVVRVHVCVCLCVCVCVCVCVLLAFCWRFVGVLLAFCRRFAGVFCMCVCVCVCLCVFVFVFVFVFYLSTLMCGRVLFGLCCALWCADGAYRASSFPYGTRVHCPVHVDARICAFALSVSYSHLQFRRRTVGECRSYCRCCVVL